MSTWTAESDSCPISFSIDAKCDTYRIKMKLYAKSGVKINLYVASLDASQDNYIYLHLQNRKMIPSTLCTSLDIEYLNENGIIMRERRIISKLHLFIDKYEFVKQTVYRGWRKIPIIPAQIFWRRGVNFHRSLSNLRNPLIYGYRISHLCTHAAAIR